MWAPFQRRNQDWNVQLSNPEAMGPTDVDKIAHELRLAAYLLPAVLSAEPRELIKRESPDFEVPLEGGALFAEVVEAVPDAVSESGTMNVAAQRNRPLKSGTPCVIYRVETENLAGKIRGVIAEKIRKATQWVKDDPRLAGKLILLMSTGQAPMRVFDYFQNAAQLEQLVPLTSIEPFSAVVLGDETGAYVWRP